VRVCQFRHTGFCEHSYSVKSQHSQTKTRVLHLTAAGLVSGPARRKIDPNPAFQGVFQMNEEALNMSLRKFLKVVGVTSQQEIEKAIRAAVADGRLKGNEAVNAQMVLTIGKINLTHKVDGTIELS
jgi:Family of unknown function (DUF6494)